MNGGDQEYWLFGYISNTCKLQPLKRSTLKSNINNYLINGLA